MTRTLRDRVIITALGFFVLAVLLLSAGCTSGMTSQAVRNPGEQLTGTQEKALVERVEVYHFHGDRQCDSCIAIGDLAEKTVMEHFRDEFYSGKLVFAHINWDRPENAGLAAKYNVTGSSLWIGVYDQNGFHPEQDTRVWSLTGDPDLYKAYLSELISRRLDGDYS
jgi:hypothetical protein